MVQSMTGFSRVEGTLEGAKIIWELRSINYRYLDFAFRLPEGWRFLEPKLRSLAKNYLSRGKIEGLLQVPAEFGITKDFSVNKKLLNSLLKVSEELVLEKGLSHDLNLSFFLKWPGLIDFRDNNLEPYAELVCALFEKSLKELVEARKVEGKELKGLLTQHLQALLVEIKEARLLTRDVETLSKDKFLTRLQALEVTLDPVRIEQELALLISKMDVNEELDRLTIHAKEALNVLTTDKASGKRLDFLMQELNREANTLGAKTNSIALTQRSLEIKVLIEQMREQIQNLE